jgi:hypothetical protein
MILKLVLLSSILFLPLIGCGEIITQTKIVSTEIPIQTRPKPVVLNDIKFYVVNKENLNEFINKFTKENKDLVFFAFSVKDYESMAINLSELRRFILQQNNIIVYYEDSIKRTK